MPRYRYGDYDDWAPADFWWNAPYGWSDYDLYDYNNNFILEDNEIHDIVTDNIAADGGIPLSDQNKIEVKVKDGVVTLSGEVKYPRTKPLAYTDAYWSSGVIDVMNNLKVNPHKRRQQAAKK